MKIDDRFFSRILGTEVVVCIKSTVDVCRNCSFFYYCSRMGLKKYVLSDLNLKEDACLNNQYCFRALGLINSEVFWALKDIMDSDLDESEKENLVKTYMDSLKLSNE